VRELRGGFDPLVAQGPRRTLSLQRMRTVPQDERHEPTSRQTAQTAGKLTTHQTKKMLSLYFRLGQTSY